MKERGRLFLIVALMLLVGVCLSGLAEAVEGEEAVPLPGTPDDTQQYEPQEPDVSEPGQEQPGQQEEPTQPYEPATQEPIVPLPGEPQPEPTVEERPTEAPTEAPAPEETASYVNVTMYIRTSGGSPAGGYTVYIDDTGVTADGQGMVQFTNVNVGQHSVRIVSPDGDQSVGRLYMSRGATTVLTDQAMGGTYGMNIADGQNDIYLVISFIPGEGMEIASLSNSPPAIPQAQASAAPVTEIQYPSKTVIATFLNDDNTALSNLTLTLNAGSTSLGSAVTDNRGQATIRDVAYGTYDIHAQGSGLDTSFTLVLQPSATTGINLNSGTDFVVGAAANASTLYLQFQRVGDLLVLTDASDSPFGGISPMVLGIIIIAAVIAIIVVIIVLLRRKSKRRKQAGAVSAPRYQEPVAEPDQPRDALTGEPIVQEPPEPEPVRRQTSGANKYHDRQRM